MDVTHPDPQRTYRVAASRRIEAPAAAVYGVFADYREAHPRILPTSFFGPLVVEQGGYGAGTIIRVEGRVAGRSRFLRGIVTEPEPGRLLVESYPEDRMVTSFRVEAEPGGGACTATITTDSPRPSGIAGWIEERVARWILARVFREELELVAAYVAAEPRGEGKKSSS